MQRLFSIKYYWLISILVAGLYSSTVWSKPSVLELETRLAILEGKLQNNLTLELANKLENLQTEIQELRGMFEEQQDLLIKINSELLKELAKKELPATIVETQPNIEQHKKLKPKTNSNKLNVHKS